MYGNQIIALKVLKMIRYVSKCNKLKAKRRNVHFRRLQFKWQFGV